MTETTLLLEKLAEFNREKRPERAVHAKGAGARGAFSPYMDLSEYTLAPFLKDPELKTPVFVRFSTFSGHRGSPDTLRDSRGFAVKFYTGEGNLDLLSSSFPVFYIRTPEKFPALAHSLQVTPQQPGTVRESFWRFVAENPQALHGAIRLYTDKGTRKSYRHMEAYGVNTYCWFTGKSSWLVRHQWKPLSGIREIHRQEAEFLAGFDPQTACKDLWNALQEGEAVEYELLLQILPVEEAGKHTFGLMDPTQLWPEEQIPPLRAGKLRLTEAADFQTTEEAAFSPGNLVPGICLSKDPLLQTMAFSCGDAQRYRLGTGYRRFPVNAPLNSAKSPPFQPIPELPVFTPGDDYRQAGDFLRGLTPPEKNELLGNMREDMEFLEESLQNQIIRHFRKANSPFGEELLRFFGL